MQHARYGLDQGIFIGKVDPGRGTVTGQILLFGMLFVLLASCTDSLISTATDLSQEGFAHHALYDNP